MFQSSKEYLFEKIIFVNSMLFRYFKLLLFKRFFSSILCNRIKELSLIYTDFSLEWFQWNEWAEFSPGSKRKKGNKFKNRNYQIFYHKE